MPSKRIGSGRSSRIYRLVGFVYLATLGGAIVIPIAGLLAFVFFVIDIVIGFFIDGPVERGRTIGTAPLRHQIKVAKWVFFGEEYPGAIPTSADTAKAAA